VKKTVDEKQRKVFILPDDEQPVVVEFMAKDLSGTFEFNVMVDAEEKYLERPDKIKHDRPAKLLKYSVDFIYQPGLESLHKYNDPNLYLYQGTGESAYHPSKDSHYGKPELNAKIREVARQFNAEFSEDNVLTHINDMSLPWGGTFKIGNNYRNSEHKTHNTGDQVDISFNSLSNGQQRAVMDKIIQEVFSEDSYDFHGEIGLWHWHCSISKRENEKRGMHAALLDVHKKVKNNKAQLAKFQAEIKLRGIESEFQKAKLHNLKLARPSSSIKWQFDPDWIDGNEL